MGGVQTINATEFKAKCLSLLNDIEQRGTSITVTRRGHPIAVLSPAPKTSWKSPRNRWSAKASITGDIVNSDTSQRWEAVTTK